MGRRSLRKISPAIDLSRHLLKIVQPFSAASTFGREAPLEIEVGSGKGLFLVRAAAARPEHDFLGIELAERYARFTAARLAKLNIPNARIVHGDGVQIFREFLPDGCAHAVHVYFPDPWWKKRHRKRRVLTEPFLNSVARVLQVEGQLHFWTDVEEYFLETLQLLRGVSQLDGPINVTESPAEHDLDYRTHFERRMRLNALPVYRSLFIKKN